MTRLLSLLLAALLAACGDSKGQSADPATPQATPVTVSPPVIREVRDVLRALGSVESIDDPTVAAETAGRIVALTAAEGDAVAAGQPLATIDSTLHRIESAKAEAEFMRQQTLHENQEKEVARLTRLAATQAVSQDLLEDQQDQLQVLTAQREAARQQREQARYLESKTRVLAPLPGRVARRHVSIGDYVGVGQALFDLVSIDTLQARLSFPEHQAARIAAGQQVLLHSPTAPGVDAVGTVTSINPRIKLDNRAVEVIVQFANPGGWLPGSSVDATLIVAQRPNALTVPRLSVVNRDGRDIVYVVDGSLASARPVELGTQQTEWVEVLSGLAASDRVVVEGAALITDGIPLSIVDPGA